MEYTIKIPAELLMLLRMSIETQMKDLTKLHSLIGDQVREQEQSGQ